MRAFMSMIACASESARCRSVRSMCKASRCAVFGPTPGRRDSSEISRSSGSGSSANVLSLLQQARRQTQPGAEGLHLRRGQLPRMLERFVHSGHDEILQHLDVLGRARVDAHRDELLRACRHRAHHTTTGARLDRLVLELFLDLAHAVLHLLDLLEHLHGVFHSGHSISFTRVTLPSKRRTTSRTNGSSSGLDGFSVRPTSAEASFNRYSTFTSLPNHARTSGIRCVDCSCAFW